MWDPATDPHLPARFSADVLAGKRACKAALQREYGLAELPEAPLFAFRARLTAQKGLDLLLDGGVLDRRDAQFVLLGEGESRYADALARRAAASPDTIGVRLAFTDPAEHRLLAGADACLMPSVYEPCGLTQMRAQRYGALPVAHRVGGLSDTVVDGETGFLFAPHAPQALAAAVARAIAAYAARDRWTALMRTTMRSDFGSDRFAAAYDDLYGRALTIAA